MPERNAVSVGVFVHGEMPCRREASADGDAFAAGKVAESVKIAEVIESISVNMNRTLVFRWLYFGTLIKMQWVKFINHFKDKMIEEIKCQCKYIA